MWVSGASTNDPLVPFPAPCGIVLQIPAVQLLLNLLRCLSKAQKLLRQGGLSQGILWPVPFQDAPVSAPQASLPIIKAGDSFLDLNMAMLSP